MERKELSGEDERGGGDESGRGEERREDGGEGARE